MLWCGCAAKVGGVPASTLAVVVASSLYYCFWAHDCLQRFLCKGLQLDVSSRRTTGGVSVLRYRMGGVAAQHAMLCMLCPCGRICGIPKNCHFSVDYCFIFVCI